MATPLLHTVTRHLLLGAALAAPFLAAPVFAQMPAPQTPAAPNTPGAPFTPAPNPLMMPTGGPSTPTVYDWDGKPKADANTAGGSSAQGPGTNGASPSNGTQAKKPLSYFLYDFFAPARQIILARHAALRRAYEQGTAPSGTSATTRRGTANGAANDPNGTPGGTGDDGSAAGAGALPQGVPTKSGGAGFSEAEYQAAMRAAGNAGALGGTTAGDGTPSGDGPDSQALQYQRLLAARHLHPMTPGTVPTPATPPAGGMGLPIDPTLTPKTSDDPQPGDLVNAGGDGSSLNGYGDVSDPLTQLSRNVTTSIPPNYQLGPGDALTVRYWSATRPPRDFNPTLDAQGAVILEGGRRVTLRGATTAQAESLLRQQLGHLYRGVQVSISLKELRTISVTVSGEAFAPGTYVVPCVATAFNVLYAAGGPSPDGTLRQVEIRRRGKLVANLDVYKFITVGEQAGDVSLQSGDILYIGPRITQVTVAGEVRHAAIFELKEHETLRDALRFAGGIKPSGVAQRLQISTLDPGAARVLRDVNLHDVQAKPLPLYDGDTVEVFSVRDTLMNRVTVEGAVDQPGDYAIAAGMRVSDLLTKARGTLEDASLTRADLYRWNPDNTTTLIPVDVAQALAGDPAANIPLARWDRLKIYHRDEIAWTGHRQAEVRGAVQRPGIYQRSDDMHVSDLLRVTGGLTPDAYRDRAVLLHRHGDGTFAYAFVRIADALNGDKTQDLPVQDDDVLAVYKVGEAQFVPDKTVTICGEVIAAGSYPRGEGMRLNDLLKLAGGLKPGAAAQIAVSHARLFANDADTKTATIRVAADAHGFCSAQDDPILADGDVVTVQGTDGFKSHVEIVTIKGAVNHPGPVVLDRDDMRLSDAIRQAGGLSAQAFPEGTEFNRAPNLIGTAGQRSLATIISRLNDVLNQSDYQREQAKSDIERIKAATNASQSNSSPLAGLTGGTAATSTAANPAAATLDGQLAKHDLVTAPRVLNADELEADGNVAIDLAQALRHPGGGDDIKLMEGDTITIPDTPTTVQVVGAVTTARAVLYHSGSGVAFYVANAGGFTADAARDRIVIIHQGGGLIPAAKAGALRPGDVVVVPTKVMAEKLAEDRSSGGIQGLFKSITSSAIALKLATSLFGL